MLRKLMKHEFRATGRIMLPLYLLVLLLGLGSNGAVRILSNSSSAALNILAGVLIFIFVIAIITLSVVALVLMINRFRTNLMSDEGYIMFTLPVSVHQLVWSKLLVSTVWMIGTMVVDILAVMIAIFRVEQLGSILADLAETVRELTAQMAISGTAVILEVLLLWAVSCIVECLIFYAAMAVGHSFANHKTLLSVAFFFVFYIALQIVSSFGFLWLSFTNLSKLLPDLSVHGALWSGIAVAAVVGAVFYLITTLMLKRRLNLE